MKFIVGCDLGQASDYTAIVVLERTGSNYHLRHLERFMDRSYPEIVQHVAELMARIDTIGGRPQIEVSHGLFMRQNSSVLVLDGTGVGRAATDLFIAAKLDCRVVPITITGGTAISSDGPGYRVPKRDLIATAQVLLQSGRLRFARELPLLDILIKELGSFKVKITLAANEVFGEWRTGHHDDCVLALCLACWAGERLHAPTAQGEGCLVEDKPEVKKGEPRTALQHLIQDGLLDLDADW